MQGRNFASQNQARMIYKDLGESHSLLQERTQYFMRCDQCFGHLPVVRCLPDQDVCQVTRYLRFSLVLQNIPVQQNVISSLGR